MSQSKKPPDLVYYLVCNYGTQGNFKGHPVYTVGEACSKCPGTKKCNAEFKGLCGDVTQYAYKCPCEDLLEDNNNS